MPDGKGSGEEQKSFITQKITGRKEGLRGWLRFFLKSAAGGAVFAAAALCTASLLGPAVRARFETGETQAVLVGRDSQESTAAGADHGASQAGQGAGETGAESGAGGSTSSQPAGAAGEGSQSGSGAAAESSGSGETAAESSAAETAAPQAGSEGMKPEEVRKAIREELSRFRPDLQLNDLLKLSGTLRAAADGADLSVARVLRVQEGVDWFDNAFQTAGIYSGIAVARTGSELLVLTTEEAVNGADALTVAFGKRGAVEASVKRRDPLSGLAVLSVPINDDNREQMESIPTVPLGNSYLIRRGDPVLSVGSPLGMVHSADYGTVNLVSTGTSVTDGSATVFYTDACGSAQRGTWILNLSGELVGWVTDALHDKTVPQTAVVGLSDFKAILEHMMNGQASPLFGIHGVAVLPELQSQGMPAGVFVTDETRNGPAYEAGIQPGDIITGIGEEKIDSMREFAAALEKLHAQDMVRVTVMRNGREEYTPIEFQLTVGAR